MPKKIETKPHIKAAPEREGAKLVDQYFNHVGDAYLKHSEPIHHVVLEEWRPKLFSLTRLNPYYGGLMGIHRKHVGVGKDKLVWLEVGAESSPALVLLHGFSAAKEHWLPLLPFFLGHFRIIMPDLPGWGESGFNPRVAYGIEEQSERLNHWLSEIGIRHASVVGNSMGGAIAGMLAARFPDRVSSLVLMDALGLPGEEQTDFVDELLQGKNRLVPRSAMEVVKLTELVFYNRALAASAAFFSATELVHRRDVNTHLFREMVARRPNLNKPTYEDIAAPTLVMWGDKDEVLHPSCALTFEKLIKRSELCILEGVGHLPMIESPYLCAQAIKDFVKKNL